jgi:arginase
MNSVYVDKNEANRFSSRGFFKTSAEKVWENPEEAAREALDGLEKNVDRFVLHFDVDVLDHQEFPCADVPHKNGLSIQDAIRSLKIIFASNKLGGFVLTEFNPFCDSDGSNARRLVEALGEALKGVR